MDLAAKAKRAMAVKSQIAENPKTLEEMRCLQRRFDRLGNIGVALYLPMIIILAVVCPVLALTVPATHVPWVLRPLWHPIPLIFLLGIPFVLIVRFSPLGRRVAPLAPLSRAINAFFLAETNYKKWEETGKKRHLIKSQQFLGLCRQYLDDVPEFQELKKSINVAMAASP